MILPPRIASTAASWLSNTRAVPLNFKMESSTPAVFTIQPSSAMLPYRTAKGWQPAEQRPRKVSKALKAYAMHTTSASKGAVRDI
jgi:hypothetical protein